MRGLPQADPAGSARDWHGEDGILVVIIDRTVIRGERERARITERGQDPALPGLQIQALELQRARPVRGHNRELRAAGDSPPRPRGQIAGIARLGEPPDFELSRGVFVVVPIGGQNPAFCRRANQSRHPYRCQQQRPPRGSSRAGLPQVHGSHLSILVEGYFEAGPASGCGWSWPWPGGAVR